jgi:hypothetical protein
MAFLPCDHGLHPFRGKSATVYSALNVGSTMDRTKLRLCPDHAAVVAETLAPHEVPSDRGAELETQVATCMTCGSESDPESRRMLFVTAYFGGDDRRDFWSGLHPGCPMPPVLRPAAPTS